MNEPEFKKRTPHGIKPVLRAPTPITPTGVRPVQRDRLSWQQFKADETRYDNMPFRACGRM